jgi:hypothetical protein
LDAFEVGNSGVPENRAYLEDVSVIGMGSLGFFSGNTAHYIKGRHRYGGELLGKKGKSQ